MQAEKDILDFIIIGAQKAGTTSLFRYLRQHPEVSLPNSKEAPFFCADDAYARGFATYMRNIAREIAVPDPARKWGTATPHYMSGGVYQSTSESAVKNGYDERTVPLRIHESLPSVRLIAILRDPVERALSGHREAVMKGQDRRSFDDAIEELLQSDALESARRRPQHMGTGYVVWGEYGRILAGYFDVFPREQILVVFTDELERAPAQLLSRIQEFIGVRADFVPDDLGEKYNAGVAVRQFSWMSPSSWMTPYSPLSPQGVQLALRHNSAVRAVWDVVPEGSQRRLRRRYQRVARRAALRNQRGSGDRVNPATLALLREHYAQDSAQLAALLGVTPPWA
ncbi:MAG: sulfotransferase family protein [Solirubrobacterales bacterium]